MGSGSYDYGQREVRAQTYYQGKSQKELFSAKMHKDMNPKFISIRECRFSEEHPEAFPIILGLDVTGSMGRIPHELIQNSLPSVIKGLQEAGIASPQVCFVGVGDHFTDRAPLQIGQFEASDELMDKWLKNIYLEGNGGGNNGESYHLAWYFGGFMTSTDYHEKLGKKGVLITIGDEPLHDSLKKDFLSEILDNRDISELSVVEILDKAKESFDVYHIGLNDRGSAYWTELLGRNYLRSTKNIDEIVKTIVEATTRSYKNQTISETTTKPEVVSLTKEEPEIL